MTFGLQLITGFSLDRATLLTISAAVTPHHAPRRRRAAARALLARRARVGAAGLREAEAAP